MRERVALLVVAAAVLLGVALWRNPGSGAAARPTSRDTPRALPVPSSGPSPGAALLTRNVFEYADEAEPAATRSRAMLEAPVLLTPPAIEPATAPPPVRLVGVLRRGGQPRAALAIEGEVVILSAGEESRGYRVASIDEDAGVVVRGPDGVEQRLTPPDR